MPATSGALPGLYPSLLWPPVPLSGTCMQLQQSWGGKGGGGRVALLGPEPRVHSRRGRCGEEPPLLIAVLVGTYRRLPSSFTNSLSATSSYHCCSCWRVAECPVAAVGRSRVLPPAATTGHPVTTVGAVGDHDLAFSHSCRKPPGRGVCCIFVRFMHSFQSRSNCAPEH
ncbi:hypothetical protein NDU88_005607 [Pleurodeles waltl]|uniref:Secreted protein n=1 Tax=Pleurodeles waltl TaxID=8319 RepID=A0AAV7PK26_PLEWA|nr:hypothetical protein NDU88_005607 [Pleurodeles waltl]